MLQVRKRSYLVLVLIGVLTFMLTSCEKVEVEPYYAYETTPVDTTNWEDTYVDGGLWGSDGDQSNPLVNTKWVLTKVVTAFSTERPYDTLIFVSNTQYRLNNNGVRNYQLSSVPTSTDWSLTLNYFAPFGGSHYTANVGLYFIDDGVINNAEFEDDQNGSASTIRAWFERVQ